MSDRKYYYSGKNEKGQIEGGEVMAANLEEAKKQVELKNLLVLSLEEETKFELNFSSLFNRVSVGDKALFSRQISTMVGAGYDLTDALKVIGSQTPNQYLRRETASFLKAAAKAVATPRHRYERLVVAGDPQVTRPAGRPRGAMLRAYDKATGREVGAVFLPAQQSGSPMTYMLNGRQYIVVSVSGGVYSGELLAFRLPS